jgi:hypothetical protein
MRLVIRLSKELSLSRDRVMLIPGNHDINIIEIRPDRFKRWTRGYVPERKAWIGDTHGSVGGHDWRDEQTVAFVVSAETFAGE